MTEEKEVFVLHPFPRKGEAQRAGGVEHILPQTAV